MPREKEKGDRKAWKQTLTAVIASKMFCAIAIKLKLKIFQVNQDIFWRSSGQR